MYVFQFGLSKTSGFEISSLPLSSLSSILPLQFNLRRAAKARIERMTRPHPKRKDLAAPEYVKKEWETGDRNALADLLQSVNFQKDRHESNIYGITMRACLLTVSYHHRSMCRNHFHLSRHVKRRKSSATSF